MRKKARGLAVSEGPDVPLVASSSSSAATVDASDPHNLRAWSNWSLYGCLGVLVLSGTLKTLTTQLATNQGAAHTSSLILIWINYLGQWMFGVISKCINARKKAHETAVVADAATPSIKSIEMSAAASPSAPLPAASSAYTTQTLLIFIAALDVFGCIFCLLATVLIGSGLYQVLYASILVMIALLSQAILGYKQNTRQWICLILVTLGLWACSLVSNQPTPTTVQELSAINATTTVSSVAHPHAAHACTNYFPSFVCDYVSLHMLGVILTLIGTFIYAVQSVLCELMNTSPTLQKVSAGELNGSIGWYGLVMSSVYIALYTIPNWSTLVSEPMAAHSLDWLEVFEVLGLYLLSNLFHRITYWTVVEQTGSIFAGLANALRTVTVFFLSSALFCATNSAQCLTADKTYAAMAVVAGVVCYQLASRKTSPVPIRVHGAHAMLSPRSVAAMATTNQAQGKKTK
jgi:hypothetical protein